MKTLSDQLRASFVSAIESQRSELQDRGITFGEVEYEVWNSDKNAFSSEIRVSFYRSGELVDVFEFHLFRNGSQVVTKSDIEKWVKENIETVGA